MLGWTLVTATTVPADDSTLSAWVRDNVTLDPILPCLTRVS